MYYTKPMLIHMPADIYEQIDARAVESNRPRTKIVFEGLRTWLSGEFTNTQYQAKPIQRQKSKSEAKIEDAPLDFLSSSGTGIL